MRILPGMEKWAKDRGLLADNGHLKPTPKAPKKNGYAGIPGNGPEGESCRTCRHKCAKPGCEGHYLKCLLIKDRWTGGYGTDILARSPACEKWEALK